MEQTIDQKEPTYPASKADSFCDTQTKLPQKYQNRQEIEMKLVEEGVDGLDLAIDRDIGARKLYNMEE